MPFLFFIAFSFTIWYFSRQRLPSVGGGGGEIKGGGGMGNCDFQSRLRGNKNGAMIFALRRKWR